MLVWMAQGTAAIAVLMFLLWLAHFPLRNAAIVDAGWAIGLALLALFYAVHVVGYWRRTLVLAAMAIIWGVRLGFHFLTRAVGPEQGRYVELRLKWGSHSGLKYLLFFEFQALLCGVLSLPFALAMHDPTQTPEAFENAGAALFIVAFLGEVIADSQLARFNRDLNNYGRVCKVGLWRYWQHPNYVFEFLIWVSFAIVAWPAQKGYLGLISPALILYFLYRVSRIPPEDQAPRKTSKAFLKYERARSGLVLWFPNYR